MNMQYLDPYKDDKYGKIRGDKFQAYFRVHFSEAKIYKTDDAYIIAGEAIVFEGIIRAFKPALPLGSELVALPIYGKEYEIRRKDGDKWVSDKFKPSIFEQKIYEAITEKEAQLVGDNLYHSINLTHVPNGMTAVMDAMALAQSVLSNFLIDPVTPSGSLPAYEPPKTYNSAARGGKGYGLSPDDKLKWLKEQLVSDIAKERYTADTSLLDLISGINDINPLDVEAKKVYFDLLRGCL